MGRQIEAPEGWKISLLDSVTKRGSGHTPDKQHPEYWNGGIKWVSLADSHRLDAGAISETDKEISELGVAKSRHGSTGKVRMKFEAKITRFSDLADDSYQDDQYD